MATRSKRGFASMDPDLQKEIASKGGKAAHESGKAHEFGSREAAEAGRKGGEVVSEDRGHMAEIGRKGGAAVSGDRKHMAEIGRKGGESRGSAVPAPQGGSHEQHSLAGRQNPKTK